MENTNVFQSAQTELVEISTEGECGKPSGQQLGRKSLPCLFNGKIQFNADVFRDRFPSVKTGVDYSDKSESFKSYLKHQAKELAKIEEKSPFEHDGGSTSYKELFGKVASVGQSYFTEDDFGQVLSHLFDSENGGFDLSEEKILNLEHYFSKKANDRKNNRKNDKSLKQYATPKAATCRLLMALFPDTFCPIPTPDKVDKLIGMLSNDGFIVMDGIKISGNNWLIKWCIYNNLLFQIFNSGSQTKQAGAIEPWNALVQYGQEKKREEIRKLLEENHNIILTGAPGTGKTYMAKQIAVEMSEKNSGITFSSKDVENKFKKLKDKGFVDFVQFHPSYDYTDFVEGLRPFEDTNSFKRMDGSFKDFCSKAYEAEKEDERKEKNKKRKYVFIIDEINRGEISKIFGELFFSIDPGYRGLKGIVKTQYQNLIPLKVEVIEKGKKKEMDNPDPFKDGFFVPNNVYIIGTMNDIDRSVESMDFAFRRRFAFKEIKAEESKSMLWDGDNSQILEEVMDCINKKLVEPQFGLSEAYQIGASYFNKIKKKDGNHEYKYEEELKNLWEYHIKGLLFEYLRGKPNAADLLKQLEKAYYKEVQEEADSENDETQR